METPVFFIAEFSKFILGNMGKFKKCRLKSFIALKQKMKWKCEINMKQEDKQTIVNTVHFLINISH